MKLFVSNFPFTTTEQELGAAFSEVGNVQSACVMSDRQTGRPRGFGFVVMGSPADAEAAIDRLDGSSFGGRTLHVAPAKEQESRHGERRDRAPREARW